MRNSVYNEKYKDDPFYPYNIVVIVQYERKLKSQNIIPIIRDY